MKNRVIFALILALLSRSWPAAAAPAPAQGPKTVKVGLDQFSKFKTVELKTISTSFPINFSIPDRWRPAGVRLSLHYVNSVTLIHQSSQLTVSLNGHPIGQTRLDPARPDGVLLIDVPAGRLSPGYNTLNFSVAQHYQDSCEQWDSPNLWTSLDLEGSFLEMTYFERSVPANLSKAVDFLFDAKAFPHGEVHVVVDIASADSVETAGALAAGLARRFGYKKVLFTASDAIVPGRDNVVVGPKEFAEAAAARAGLTLDVGGSVLQVSPLPVGRDAEGRSLTDPTRGLVVVSGKDAAEVRRSALTLGTMSIPVPGSARTEVSGVSLPETAPYAGSRLLQAGKDYSFKSLDFRTYTFRKVNPLATDIVFRLPNDYRIEPNKYMTLMLNFIYGPGMQAASSLTVSVNNEVARTIPLDKMAGDFITGYRLDLPTYLFKPGMNTLTFTSYLTPKGGDCEMILPDSYFMTLYDNSTLRFPGMTHFTRLPEIGLFMDDGFPYTRWRDGRECEIFIARADHGLLAAAFNVLGFMTQKCEHALFAARVRVGVPGAAGPAAPEKELIVIGGLDSLPPDFFDGAPLKLGKGSDSSHPAPGWGESPRFAAARQSGGIDPDDGLLMQFQSPAMRGRSTLLLTAVSDEKVVRLSRLLLLPALSAQMRGALVFVDLKAEADNKVTSVPARDGYWTGKLGRISALTYFLHVYPYTNYLLAALLLLLAGLLGTYVLVRIRRRRLAVAEGRDAGR